MVQHLLGIEGLAKEEIYNYLDTADSFVEVNKRDIKKVPSLRGKTIINVFFESSTRTLTSFDIAAKRLSADSINVSASSSSVNKGESLVDTALTLESMSPHVVVIRHAQSGAPHLVSKILQKTAVVNAGDGLHEHPTQALLDLLTLRRHFAKTERPLEGLKISIIGDVLHSRVARSNIHAHLALGNEVRLVGPATLVPSLFEKTFGPKVKVLHSVDDGLEGSDVVIVLRMQLERQNDKFITSLDEYSRDYGVSERLLKRVAPESVLLHPGPMNRGVEISTDVADGARSLIRNQVENGVAVRMAVLFKLAQSIPGHDDGFEQEEER